MRTLKKLVVLATLGLLASGSAPLGIWAGDTASGPSSIQAPLTGKVLVRIEGLACPFCAYGVEKQLKKIAGVETASVNLGAGSALLVLKAGAAITPEQIQAAVKKAGFKASEIKSVEAAS